MSLCQVLNAGRRQKGESADPALQNPELRGELVLVTHCRMGGYNCDSSLPHTQEVRVSAVSLERLLEEG